MSTVALRARAIELHSTHCMPRDCVGGAAGHTRPSQSATKVPVFRKAACPCGGGCPTCQAKLSDATISQPTDSAEMEADQMADQVMRMPEGRPKPIASALDSANSIHRKCGACEAELTLQRKALPLGQPLSSQVPTHVHSALSSGGHSLDHQTRSFFEPRLGYDLSSVRIHTDSTAGQSARAIDARAYTLGSAIVFAEGEYRPEADGGKRLLAHELAHVIQQGTGKIPTLRRQRAGESADEGEDLCSEDHEAEAREALNNAYHWIRRTIHRINSDHEGTEADLRYYFGDTYDRGTIMLRLGELQEFIREGVIVNCADPSSYPECGPDVLAYCSSYHSLMSRVVNDRTIHVCQPNFHGATASMRIATMVHEASHNYLGTNDHVTYRDIDCRAGTAVRLSDRALSENADSYGCLVYWLGRRDP